MYSPFDISVKKGEIKNQISEGERKEYRGDATKGKQDNKERIMKGGANKERIKKGGDS